MKSRRDRFGSCDAAIRSHLDPQEVVLAVGTCHDMTERRSIETTGVIAYVVVTDQSLRWTPDGDVRFEAALAFADVIAVREASAGHRYSVSLAHGPLVRPRWGPAHRFLMFAWGNKIVTEPLTHTELAFSRRETKAATALRGQLRNLPRVRGT
jgi:hypothetical protein